MEKRSDCKICGADLSKNDELEEVTFDIFHIFYEDKCMTYSANPRFYNRKYFGILGKDFLQIIRGLKNK